MEKSFNEKSMKITSIKNNDDMILNVEKTKLKTMQQNKLTPSKRSQSPSVQSTKTKTESLIGMMKKIEIKPKSTITNQSSLISINDEDEYCKTGLKKLVRRFLPEDYDSDPRKAQDKSSDQPIPDPADSCQPNFGYCYCMKLYIVITLFLAMCVYFSDPCVYFLLMPETSLTTGGGDGNGEVNDTIPILVTQINDNHTVDEYTESDSILLLQKGQKIEYCEFKFAYIISLIVGLLIYGLIFIIYTCQLIIHFYNFPWYLSESILLGCYSIILLIMSIVAYVTSNHAIGTSLAFIDSLIGIILAFVIFRNHRDGIVPAALIVQYDPDGNLLTQILSRRHFV
ncbi:hypothetical protein HUG17_8900 [Dermatophagoides farinae]|uniref:Uncharacterized protein n=1 Tax=Dermatophagoides farinae TaxID=6954 RepID=A0A9D4NRM6_DERFA|nr:uncharacterized protein LOC124497316 [Dermatophagoides farinae]KAH7637796.1 hypothetical protein HUG17_8900 [Dermatophagoides farinae]